MNLKKKRDSLLTLPPKSAIKIPIINMTLTLLKIFDLNVNCVKNLTATKTHLKDMQDGNMIRISKSLSAISAKWPLTTNQASKDTSRSCMQMSNLLSEYCRQYWLYLFQLDLMYDKFHENRL